MLSNNSETFLSVEHLTKHFPLKGGFFSRQKGIIHAVNDVSFKLSRKLSLGIVGESGSGKTTVGKCLLRLIEPTSGRVWINGLEISNLAPKGLFPVREKMQMIYQDPYASLNPRMTVEEIVAEGLRINRKINRRARKDSVADLLRKVGLMPENMLRYPHEFSGGQRQRIGIARALALRPDLIVADEPVSALDVSIRAQVINLMMDLQEEFGLTYIIISHDLAVVQQMCNMVAVMYLGKIVEMASTETLYESPRHPYTKILLASVPVPDPEQRSKWTMVQGEIPSPANPPAGCFFHPRCPEVKDLCRRQASQLQEIGGGHSVACHLRY
ncbi:MAG: ATP-binding cassette domain-containing protein [Deltaproteobacteria bacterium]|nr:ATP-binding cassette domain-containing protein [Deltaproteobacteria bacterium]